MYLVQIFILTLCSIPVWTACRHRCCNEIQLMDAVKKYGVQHPPPPESTPAPDSGSSCPLDLYKSLSKDYKDRSLSPWRYVQVHREDFFPSTYNKAECLCSGCIQMLKTGTMVENFDYVSVPLKQSRMFLKRVREGCNKNQYRLERVNEDVAVGCTCVRVNSD